MTSAPPPADDDAARPAGKTLDACLREYEEYGLSSPREAKRMIRRLRSIVNDLDDADRDLHTYLMVECFDAAKGTGAATHALQQHWEAYGGTPLVTVAVADRLVRRGEVRAALKLYARVVDRDLYGVRDPAELALYAAELAHGVGDLEHAAEFLDVALATGSTRDRALGIGQRWFPGGRPAKGDREAPDDGDAAMAVLARTPEPPPQEPSRRRTDNPPASVADAEPTTIDTAVESSEEEITVVEKLENLARAAREEDDEGRPTVDLGAIELGALASDEQLRAALEGGDYAAGDALVARCLARGGDGAEVLAVRHRQALLRRGDRVALKHLHEAAVFAGEAAYARAIDHVLGCFHSDHTPGEPPSLTSVPAQPDAAAQLLFAPLDGTINEALGIVCQSGMMRRDADDELTGADRVLPLAATPVGRVYGALTRVMPLNGARLFHRSRTAGELESRVALSSPLAAVLSGAAERETPALRYAVGAALAAATPPLALVEAVPTDDVKNLIQALIAGFGPVVEGSLAEATQQQMRMAEDLWHMVPAAADRRLRDICANPQLLSYDSARANARQVRRRAGLFACGDLTTAVMQVVHELDIPMPRPIRGEHALRELCRHPAIADLHDLAIAPNYAALRWESA